MRQITNDGGVPVAVLQKLDRKKGFRRGANCLLHFAALATMFAAACSKTQTASVLGDAAHPAPVRFYTVAEETARRRIKLSALSLHLKKAS